MSLDFNQYAAKGNAFVNRVAEVLQVQHNQAARIVRSVLHALRNRLSHEESFQLLAQLPMALKAVYVDGWKYSDNYLRLRRPEEFLDEIRKEDNGMAGYDFGNDQRAALATAAVLNVLLEMVSEGEGRSLINSLPESLQLWIHAMEKSEP
jgi:uncharacterized protein (DUF2267 family)